MTEREYNREDLRRQGFVVDGRHPDVTEAVVVDFRTGTSETVHVHAEVSAGAEGQPETTLYPEV
jgi:hypothetical protein